tara:strand:+ start:3819 stop:4751 length:933 start_codon:yes stop_codon:yes gene_type:complete
MAVACLNMSVVVIIPYYNESDVIKRTLDLISNQTIKPKSIIFVDSGSTDDTSNKINQWIKNNDSKNIKNIYSGRMSPSSSLNSGIKLSKEDIIGYVDCGLDIPTYWIESSLNLLNEENSDMVSSKIYTSGKNIIDKIFIAQTYGYENNRICLPGSLIKRSVFENIGLFLENVRASYDIDFIKKFYSNNLKRSINEKVVLKYIGFNYTNSLFNGAKKVYSYSQDGWNVKNDYKPLIYILAIITIILSFLFNFKIFLLLLITYFFMRTLFIPFYKSRNSIKLIKSLNVIYLPIVGFIIDVSRIFAYLKSLKL